MLKTTRIYLADDHQILIDGIKTLLHTNASFEVVGFSITGTDLYEEVLNSKADILILDINMPGKDGIQVIKEFSKKGFPCKIIVLSSHDDLRIIKRSDEIRQQRLFDKKMCG